MKETFGVLGLVLVIVLTTLIVVGMCSGWGAVAMGAAGLGGVGSAMVFAAAVAS